MPNKPRVARARIGAFALVLVVLTAGVRAQAPETPELTKPVNDFAHVIDAQNAATMDAQIRELEAKTGDSVVVATVPSLEGFTGIEELAVKMFENHGRGIGAKGKDNGVLIVVAPRDRRARIEVGYDLEQWITDGYSGETIREFMAPAFRRNAYGEGLAAATERIIGRIAQARGVTLTGVRPPEQRRPAGDAGGSQLGIIIVIFILIFILSRFGGGPGSRSSSAWRGSRGWSGWSSGVGGFGGGWDGGRGGGFGGGFGGFGGGRSGGGGASGSW